MSYLAIQEKFNQPLLRRKQSFTNELQSSVMTQKTLVQDNTGQQMAC